MVSRANQHQLAGRQGGDRRGRVWTGRVDGTRSGNGRAGMLTRWGVGLLRSVEERGRGAAGHNSISISSTSSRREEEGPRICIALLAWPLYEGLALLLASLLPPLALPPLILLSALLCSALHCTRGGAGHTRILLAVPPLPFPLRLPRVCRGRTAGAVERSSGEASQVVLSRS
ncbi:uncharacterized protein [Physcomitrium patens]